MNIDLTLGIIEGKRAWRAGWRTLPRRTRRRIRDAVERGEGLLDPDEAAFAVGLTRSPSQNFLFGVLAYRGKWGSVILRRNLGKAEQANLRIVETFLAQKGTGQQGVS